MSENIKYYKAKIPDGTMMHFKHQNNRWYFRVGNYWYPQMFYKPDLDTKIKLKSLSKEEVFLELL